MKKLFEKPKYFLFALFLVMSAVFVAAAVIGSFIFDSSDYGSGMHTATSALKAYSVFMTTMLVVSVLSMFGALVFGINDLIEPYLRKPSHESD